MKAELQRTENAQTEQFNRIADLYETHYDDVYSQSYRDKFIYEPVFRGIDLKGKSVLEAMCGTGQTTRYLLKAEARVTGLDISENCIARFRSRWKNAQAIVGSVTQIPVPDESYDCVVVIGGLHHVHPNIADAMTEIARVLKPGGYFCGMEPHSDSFINQIRKIWYKMDRSLFAANEAAINMARLKKDYAGSFRFNREVYFGNVAYYVIMNSMILRIPLPIKKILSKPAMLMESFLGPLQSRHPRLGSVVLFQWQKR